MKQPDLSFCAIAATLAVLGTAACSKHHDNASAVQAEPSATPAVVVPPASVPVTVAVPAAQPTASVIAPPDTPPSAPARAAPAMKDMNGQASCGAGNCATDVKKK